MSSEIAFCFLQLLLISICSVDLFSARRFRFFLFNGRWRNLLTRLAGASVSSATMEDLLTRLAGAFFDSNLLKDHQ